MEMIQQVNINVSLMDAIQVPTYARYLKDIINNKRPLPTTEVVKLTEACSATILQQLSEEKKESGCPTIICWIGTQNFDKALCGFGFQLQCNAQGNLWSAELLNVDSNTDAITAV